MKKYLYLFYIAILLFACSKNTDNVFTIQGKIENCKMKTLGVADLVNVYFDSININNDNSFKRSLKLPVTPIDIVISFPNDLIWVYVQNGYTTTTINADCADSINPKIKFDGDGKVENEFNLVFYKNFGASAMVREKDEVERILALKNFSECEKYIDAKVDECNKLLQKITDKTAFEYKKSQLNCSTLHYKLVFAHNPNVNSDGSFDAFVRAIDLNNINYAKDEKIVSDVASWYVRNEDNKDVAKFDFLKQKISNQATLNVAATNLMEQYFMRLDDNIVAVFDKYKTVCTDTASIASFAEKYKKATALIKGAVSPNFEINDVEEKTYSLADFKGKALYIDVWATWCGPCKQEIPHLAKLVEKFKNNKNIEFISISVDKKKDAWKTFIAKDKPAWRQFIIVNPSEDVFSKTYNINGIPRFIFIDKDGKIISTDAPRPSDDGIIDYINSNL